MSLNKVKKYMKSLSNYMFGEEKPREVPVIEITSIKEWESLYDAMLKCFSCITSYIFGNTPLHEYGEFLDRYLGYEVVSDEYRGTCFGYVIDVDVFVKIGDHNIRYDDVYNNIKFASEEDISEEKIEPETISYVMSEEEIKAANAFKDKHKNCNGLFSYIITPNPIGTNLSIKCTCCGETKDICDYNW